LRGPRRLPRRDPFTQRRLSYRELMNVRSTLDLTDIRRRLKELDPWTIEQLIRDEILRVEPHVVVSFPIAWHQ
jgi:hypothetical protein